MSSKPMSREDRLKANRLAMEKNKKRGKDALGNDHGNPNLPVLRHERGPNIFGTGGSSILGAGVGAVGIGW